MIYIDRKITKAYAVGYDAQEHKWKVLLHDERELPFDQAIVTTPPATHPASSTVRFKATHGLEIPQGETLPPAQLRDLGVSAAPKLGRGAGEAKTNWWRLTEDGRIERMLSDPAGRHERGRTLRGGRN